MKAYYRDKFAVVLGGSEGIGLATAVALAEQGCDVVIGSRSPAKLAAGCLKLKKVRQRANQILASLAVDVTQEAGTAAALQNCMKLHRTPDILINSAGFAVPAYLDQLPVSQIRAMMDLNYFGVVHAVKAVLPEFQRLRKGSIVNVASMASFLGLFGYTGYCASKYAVIGFSEALRHEVQPYGIHISVVCPPNTWTPGLEKENAAKPKELLALERKTKTVSPEAVAKAIVAALPVNPFLIHPTTEGALIYRLSRSFPSVTARFLQRPAL